MSRRQQVKARTTQSMLRFAIRVLNRLGDPIAGMTDPRVAANPYPFYEKVRSKGPLVSSRLPNMFATSSHQVVSDVLRSNDFGVGSTDPDALSPLEPDGVYHPLGRHSLLSLNPPDHSRLRKLVARPFTPRAIKQIEDRVREVVDETIDRHASAGHMDFMELAATIPVVIICEILGVPTEDEAQFKRWGEAIAPTLDPSLDPAHHAAGIAALGPLNDYFDDLFERRRGEPGEAIVDGLLRAEGEDGALSHAEVMTTALLILVAGFETTVNLLGNGMHALLSNPEQLAMLTDEPSLAPKVVEETLRFDSPVQSTGRTALRETEVAGRTVPEGALVITFLGGANRDPLIFDRPTTFDMHRANAEEHLSFSSGHHFCLGAPLARMEGAVAFERLAERLADLRMDGPARRRKTQTLRGLQSLPISFTAA